MKKNKRITFPFLYWIPVFVWAGVIYYFSNSVGITTELKGYAEFPLRKIAHVGEFGFLALLLLVALRRGCKLQWEYSFLGALLLSGSYALSDEWHQTFIAGRSGNLKDVAVDFLGAMLFLQITHVLLFVKKRGILLVTIVCNVIILVILVFFMLQGIISDDMKEEKQNRAVENNEQLQSEQLQEREVITEKVVSELIEAEESGAQSEDVERKETFLQEIILDVPFSSQAPFGVWDEVHEEACEEMSLIMAKYFYDKKDLAPQAAEREIQELKEYQLKKNGHFIDSNMYELAQIASDFYGIKNTLVKEDVTEKDILKSLNRGNPVIIPTTGRGLGNPNFTQPGPLYHNLIIIGYDSQNFITNDPGTRKGRHYTYSRELIMQTIHDFPGDKKNIETGPRRALFFENE